MCKAHRRNTSSPSHGMSASPSAKVDVMSWGAALRRVYTAGRLLLFACSVTSGCVPTVTDAGPREPRRTLPAHFATTSGAASRALEAGANVGQTSWREFFSDPRLVTLIETALRNNQELNLQVQELLIAKYEIMAASGEYLPKVSAEVGAGIDKVGAHTSQGVADEANGVPNPLADYRFGFSASWEVDVWKKLRNAAKAATFRYLASVEGRNFAVTRLVAEIASTYTELAALDRQLQVLDSNIDIQEQALEVVKLQKLAARVTQLAVQRFEAEVLANRSRKFRILQQIVEKENHLNFLVGRFPQKITRDAGGLDQPLPDLVRVGVPATLLDNRPDVRRAEHALEASKLDVEVAKARFYPALSIEAGVGYEAFNAEHLVATPESLVGNLAGNLSAPLLNRRAIEADYFAANARQVRAVIEYEQAVLTAFTEVSNQLSLLDNLQRSFELEARQVETLNQAIAVSNTLFQSARADYMEVLLTRRDALEAQIELINTQREQRLAMVHLYEALGGGWR